MLVNSVDVIGSAIVLIHQDDYRQTGFIVEKLHHEERTRSGLYWGFSGRIEGLPERLYAPSLADGKALRYSGLQRAFPAGKTLAVWYNPAVTTTLMQRRTLHVLPYTPDIAAPEWARIRWWLEWCLLPFLSIWLLSIEMERRRPPSATAGPELAGASTPIPPKQMGKVAGTVVLVALSPILVPLLLGLLAVSLLQALLEFMRTGKWPRNEAFIERMKARSKQAQQKFSRRKTP
jgi:hypothetical protein